MNAGNLWQFADREWGIWVRPNPTVDNHLTESTFIVVVMFAVFAIGFLLGS